MTPSRRTKARVPICRPVPGICFLTNLEPSRPAPAPAGLLLVVGTRLSRSRGLAAAAAVLAVVRQRPGFHANWPRYSGIGAVVRIIGVLRGSSSCGAEDS